MKTRWWVVALFAAFFLGWSGHYLAQDQPQEVECVAKLDIPPCICNCIWEPDGLPRAEQGPAAKAPPAEPPRSAEECPPCPEPNVKIRVEPASYRYLIHGVVGDAAYGAGVTWNREGRFKPTALALWDARGDKTVGWGYRSEWYRPDPVRVDRGRFVALVGVSIGLDAR